ncbi:MAG: hypothetical protein JOZ78_08275 [Chroococcidiopsidaceae cyanobacterium CP_BM_ER_R8_30]|nr:hypothetical protein [Chroococcidiopsidaceae cyanobacterium CP_BM_ER_R8_30]
MPTLQPKSVFASKTVWGSIFTTIAAIAPIVGDAYDQHSISGKEVAQIVVILAGTAATVVGRVQSEAPLYTPDWLPGPDKKDFVD